MSEINRQLLVGFDEEASFEKSSWQLLPCKSSGVCTAWQNDMPLGLGTRSPPCDPMQAAMARRLLGFPPTTCSYGAWYPAQYPEPRGVAEKPDVCQLQLAEKGRHVSPRHIFPRKRPAKRHAGCRITPRNTLHPFGNLIEQPRRVGSHRRWSSSFFCLSDAEVNAISRASSVFEAQMGAVDPQFQMKGRSSYFRDVRTPPGISSIGQSIPLTWQPPFRTSSVVRRTTRSLQ